MKRLGSELQQQAKIVDQLNASPHGGSCDAKQLQKELHRLDLQFSELNTQVQAGLQAHHLLQRLSGRAAFLCIHHAKLCLLVKRVQRGCVCTLCLCVYNVFLCTTCLCVYNVLV